MTSTSRNALSQGQIDKFDLVLVNVLKKFSKWPSFPNVLDIWCFSVFIVGLVLVNAQKILKAAFLPNLVEIACHSMCLQFKRMHQNFTRSGLAY